jgi:hypothetical protein
MLPPSGIYPNDDFSVVPYTETAFDMAGVTDVKTEVLAPSGPGAGTGSIPAGTYSEIRVRSVRIDFNANQHLVGEADLDGTGQLFFAVPEGTEIVLNNVTVGASGLVFQMVVGLAMYAIAKA